MSLRRRRKRYWARDCLDSIIILVFESILLGGIAIAATLAFGLGGWDVANGVDPPQSVWINAEFYGNIPVTIKGHNSQEDTISRLEKLHEQGILTDEEFAAQKKKILGT